MNDLLHILPSLGPRGGTSDSTSSSTDTPSSRLKKKRSNPPPTPNPISRLVRGANSFFWSLRDGLTDAEREDLRKLEERKQILALRMKDATDAAQWTAAARELDLLEGNDLWKLDSSSDVPDEYNPTLIASRTRELDDARISCDFRAMLHLVRTALSRDLGGMDNPELYRHSYLGTKDLIERYVDSAVKTIQALVENSGCHPRLMAEAGLEDKDLLEGMLLARQAFGRSALLLSGGGTFGMMHIGVLKGMFEAKLLPRLISGASAGSIVCAVLCTRTDEEIPKVLEQFPYGDLAVFEEEGNELGWLDHMKRLLTIGSWSDIRHLTRVMRELLGDMTFQEAYNRTRRICNICVSTASIYELPRLLNYVTAPNVMIWSAVAASCSVPLVFSAAPLLVKDPVTGEHLPWNPASQQWIDGSVDNDIPMSRLAEMFNVNHFIVSQVNPHIVPFLSRDERLCPAAQHSEAPTTLSISSQKDTTPDWLYTLTTLARDEALHRLQFMAELGLFPNLATKLRSVLSQKYSGDVTILPEIALHDLPRLLANPTTDFMLRACLAGERATWPKLSRMRDRLAIELAIDRAVHALRARVVFSRSQVDLRRLVVVPGVSAGPVLRAQAQAEAAMLQQQHHHHRGGAVGSRHRRGSGSSIQLLARQRKVLGLNNSWSDEESEREERELELSRRRGEPGLWLGERSAAAAGMAAGGSKPRLRRAAKSQTHVPSALHSLSSPMTPAAVKMGSYLTAGRLGALMDETPSRPPISPRIVVEPDSERDSSLTHTHTPLKGAAHDGAHHAYHHYHREQDQPATSSPQLDPSLLLLSPTTTSHPETSDRDQADDLLQLRSSSDVGESHTDESVSDPEPYEAEASSQPVGWMVRQRAERGGNAQVGRKRAATSPGPLSPPLAVGAADGGGGLWD
ncbi:Patatin-like phospholipase domain-containing protein [Pleurostoma richardsiae]|uniref:Patatin-like phospholipase domain-containing protein n=1 Tax=Pleurostoma richardsiae TaxID=41990 RepID=A0AA38RXN1_9PEZI|nr:Patatin-like phospholipase domain-containing protein [Pleurostoma richardsiae]